MKQLIFILLLAISSQSFAGPRIVGNGGDICENRFYTVRDDINSWVLSGGSKNLILRKELSLDKYNSDMLTQMKYGKISCTEDKVFVGAAEKTCKNYVTSDGVAVISCNINRFMNTSEADQYVLVHHEYAGLAGFEKNSAEVSNYEISNQISEYLEDTIVKKLSIRPASNSAASKFDLLNSNFAKGSIPSAKEVQGWFSGRCYTSDKPDTPVGSLFGATSFPLNVEGPIFEQPNHFNVGVFHTINSTSVSGLVNPELFDGLDLSGLHRDSGWYTQLQQNNMIATKRMGAWTATNDSSLLLRIRKFQNYIMLQGQATKDQGSYKAGQVIANCYFFIKLN
ncbi:hypothetical protein [Bdellovibrio svalbardensis]|uniref:Uncharacterized protein n=1 Tax=Bdellovibrio svalbardensis TaxID=2972972 RepID=A0ABT6DQH5_9BACT|nr:hypothetical protein [Bdellovibrio svalbardensis]MDG0818071.1 hypothetical protein [Bdellovibrio svalbardensis]